MGVIAACRTRGPVGYGVESTTLGIYLESFSLYTCGKVHSISGRLGTDVVDLPTQNIE